MNLGMAETDRYNVPEIKAHEEYGDMLDAGLATLTWST